MDRHAQKDVTLWILEGDDTLGQLLQYVLPAAIHHIQVRRFLRGESVVRAAGAPDLLFAETQIEGEFSGYQVAERLRQRNPDLAVVFSSAIARSPGLKLGPQDRWLTKPFSISSVLTQIVMMMVELSESHCAAGGQPPHEPDRNPPPGPS